MATAPLEDVPGFRARKLPHELTCCKVVEVDVTVSGHDLHGVTFFDQCKTIAIAPNGAIVTINRTLDNGQEVFLGFINKEQIAHVSGHSGAGHYGLCYAAPNPEFWEGILSSTPVGTDPLLVPSFEQFEHAVVPQTTPLPPERRKERRRSPRISLRQAKACIDSVHTGQEVVELINVSRGGLCFRSERGYPLKSLISVAAPYIPNNTNVFVQVKVVCITRDAWGDLYGTEYVR